jgi:hypothetical protein
MKSGKSRGSLRIMVILSSLIGLALATIINLQYSSPVEAVSTTNAVSNGSQVFCMNKSTGALRVSVSGTCKTATEDPFVFLSTAQMGSNGFVPQAICGTNGNSICGLGSIGPGSGTVFFVDQNNDYPTFTYLEAAPAGWDGKTVNGDPTSTWCNDTTHIIQLTSNPWNSRIIGSGKSNTNSLKLSCSSGVATLVNELNTSKRNRFSDWFIPSLGELILLGTNLQGKAGLGPDDYWSSSEFSDVGGWVQSIGHGYQGNANKATLFHVRPIRAF